MAADERVGITTTLPIEVLIAAGYRPVDLNNLFVARADAEALVQEAEGAGFPRTTCAWIKGLYATAHAEGIKRVVVVTGGDCSNAAALGEVWEDEGMEVIPFSFPGRRAAEALAAEIDRLGARLGTTAAAAEKVYERLEKPRALLRALDERCWRDGAVPARANFGWHLRACDFDGDAAAFEKELTSFLEDTDAAPGRAGGVRLGLAGVPPINGDLLEFLAGVGADVVWLELPRQFALGDGGADLADAYTRYTYPYGVAPRLTDLKQAVKQRRLAGVVHYVQSFCYRGIQDKLIRKAAGVPVLTLEGETPGPLSAQQRLRLETFIEVLRGAIAG